jgi:hypothetical protein
MNTMLEKKKLNNIQNLSPQNDSSPYEVSVQLLLTEQIKNVLTMPEFEALKQKIKSNLRLK